MKKKMNFICCASLFALLAGCSPVIDETEKKIDNIIACMTLEEKIGQMCQISPGNTDDEALLQSIRDGKVGSIINVVNPETANKLQVVAINESKSRIPIIFGRDVIHGFKTIFPIPLGQAASFNPQTVYEAAQVAATEARAAGIHWTFAPMLDISRDARWGRIAESLGEDPYLCGQLGAAMVKGFQADGNLSGNAIAACMKHFAGYGAAEGGRDYNSTNIPPMLMRNVYLVPFEYAVNAGAATLMTAFNDNDGIPSSGNKYLLKNVLRDEWHFDGFVVSDWGSMTEMITHGFAKNAKEVAKICVDAGVNMEMVSSAYSKHLLELIKEGEVSEKIIDVAVRNILRIKFRLGLFDNPYTNTEQSVIIEYADAHLNVARRAAVQSAILLKNDGNILPLSETKTIAVIGPMANAYHDQLGTWCFDGEKNRTITPIAALQDEYKHVRYIYEPALASPRDKQTVNFEKAKRAVAAADVAIVFVGEEAILSGEAHSLSNINLIGAQSDLLKAVKSVGKPVVMVVIAGRPLTIERDLQHADAVLYNFHPGTMGGPAILDLIFGRENPSGKLPVTFVSEVGQIPMYYNHNNTGRPAPKNVTTLEQIPPEAGQTSLGNTSFYLDSGRDPLFPFGFGLSYSEFEYSNLDIPQSMTTNGKMTVKFTITNTSSRGGVETAQLYIRNMAASVARPVKELKGFQRVYLKAGETKEIEFELAAADMAFYGYDLIRRTEPGEYKIWVGGNSNATLQSKLSITN